MKNTQILSFLNIETDPGSKCIQTAYKIDGEQKFLDIPFEHVMSFLSQHRQKVASYNDLMGLEELNILWWPDETIRETAEAFVRAHERFDLIVENRKLRDANRELEIKLSRIKVKSIIFMPLFEGIIKNYKHVSSMGFLKYFLPRYYRSAGNASYAKASIEILNSIKEVCDERN